MGNHIHLLLATDAASLQNIFRSIGARFVYWYNLKYQRYGYLFQDRFISYPVEDDHYFMNVVQYIHENPVRAHICDAPEDYRWSSYNAYYRRSNSLIKKEPAIQIAGSVENLHHYFHSHQCEILKKNPPPKRNISDTEAIKIIKQITKASNPSEFQRFSKAERNQYVAQLYTNGLMITQITRLCGISRGITERILKKSSSENS